MAGRRSSSTIWNNTRHGQRKQCQELLGFISQPGRGSFVFYFCLFTPVWFEIFSTLKAGALLYFGPGLPSPTISQSAPPEVWSFLEKSFMECSFLHQCFCLLFRTARFRGCRKARRSRTAAERGRPFAAALFSACVFAGMPAFQIYYIMPPAKGFCKPILSENAGKPALKNRFAAQKSV